MTRGNTVWRTALKYLGLGPAEADNRIDRDEVLERLERIDGRIDDLDQRLESIEAESGPRPDR